MTGDGEGPNGTTKLEQAKDAVKSVAGTVQATTQTVADAIEAGAASRVRHWIDWPRGRGPHLSRRWLPRSWSV